MRVFCFVVLMAAVTSIAHAGQITLTIPDSKDAKVIAARDAYNLRTEQNLTTTQFVKQMVLESIVRELVLQDYTAAQTTRTTEESGWE